MKYSICVDFDGVIHSYSRGWKDDWMHDPINELDPPVDGAIEWLMEMQKHFTVIIFTTRGQYGPQAALAIGTWLAHYGFVGEFPTVTNEKPPALIYLDDRAVRFEGPGTFPTENQIHRAYVPWNKKRA